MTRPVTRPAIDNLPPYPVRGEPRVIYTPKANATAAAMPTVVTQMNAMSAWIDGVADDCEGAKTAAEAAAASSAGSANFVGEWSTLVGALAIPASVSHNGKVWVLTENLADVTASEPGVDPEWIEAFPQLDSIRLPVNVTPADTATNVTSTVLTGKPFYSLYGVAHSASQWQVSATANFGGALVVDTGDEAATNSYDIGPGILSLSTSYYWRHRFKDIDGTYSDWSTATQFSMAAGIINAPTITEPANAATDQIERLIVRVAAFSTSPSSIDTHDSTTWVFRKTSDNSIVHSSLNDTSNLLRYDVPAGVLLASTSYKVQVTFHGNSIASSATTEHTFTTAATFGYGVYLAVSGIGADINDGAVCIFCVDVSTYTQIHTEVFTGDKANGCAFSPDGKYLAVTLQTSEYIKILKRTVDSFSLLADPATLPAGWANHCAFDPSGTYLAVAHDTTPFVTIYKRSGDTFTKLADPANLPAGRGLSVAWDQDGTHLVVAHNTAPRMTVYSRSGDTFTKLADPASLIGADWATVDSIYPTPCVAFSDDLIVFSHTTTPYLHAYTRVGTTLTKISGPDIIPEGLATCVAFNADGTKLYVGQTSGSGGVTPIWYDVSAGNALTRRANPFTTGATKSHGIAASSDGDAEKLASTYLTFASAYEITGGAIGFLSNLDPTTPVTCYGVCYYPSALYGDN